MQPPSAIPLARARVLAVDDHAINLRFLAVALDGRVATLNLAESGGEAIRLAREHRFDLVLMDLHLTDMDGIEAWRRMREALDLQQKPKILALTADTRAEQHDRVRAAGFDGLLGKPTERQELLQAMQSVLNGEQIFLDPGTRRQGPARLLDDRAAIRANGSLAAARAMQAALADELQRELTRIEHMLLQGESAQAARQLHRWRGACGYAGAQRLDSACRQLEAELLDGAGIARGSTLLALWRAQQATIDTIRLHAEQEAIEPDATERA